MDEPSEKEEEKVIENDTNESPKLFVVEAHHEEDEVKARLFAAPDVEEVKKELGSMWSWMSGASATFAESASSFASRAEENARYYAQKADEKRKELEKYAEDKANEIARELEAYSDPQPAVLPWDEPQSKQFSSAIHDRCMELAKDDKSFLSPVPETVSFQFDLDNKSKVIQQMLEEDPILLKQHESLVPKAISEELFWRNYFYRISLILEAYQATAEHASEKEEGDHSEQAAPSQEEIEQSTSAQEADAGPSPDLLPSNDDLGLGDDDFGWNSKDNDLNFGDEDENFDMLDDDELLASAGLDGISDDDDDDDDDALEQRVKAELNIE